ncbi:transcription termination factor NusA [bacterium]|nr:transcription termination factor NusA [bacterium]
MNGEFLEALEQLQKEKDIPLTSLVQTVEAAMSSAYRKHYGSTEEVRLQIDMGARTMRMIVRKPILPEQPEGAEPLDLEALAEQGLLQYEEREVDTHEFGRIAAQTAKQVVMQRIREAEREIVFDEFSHRVGEVVTAEVQRKDARNVFVALGRAEALLPAHEQIPGEPYRFNDRLKVYLLEVRKTTKTPQIIVSRTHPQLVTRLFELEVPEVYDGIVQIKSVAREPGARSKVAVLSTDTQVDAVGACVGHRGARVQAIVDELRGEKIDIVRFNDDIREYLKSALSPARVSQVLPNMDEQSATVIAPDNQLSLAIGRRGQNVRLAAQLTGWRIDIRSESQWAEAPDLALAAAAASAETAAPAEAKEERRFRIYELAKELEVESKDLVEILQEEGVEVTSHASTVSEDVAKMLRELLSGGSGTLDNFEE